MNYQVTDRWPTDRQSAQAAQALAADHVVLTSNLTAPQTIAAVDTDYGFEGKTLYAAAVVLRFPEFEEIERSYAAVEVAFPYIPGLLFYREGPAILEALGSLASRPDVIIINGHGIAHPSRCGIASHVGLACDAPTIGCARKLLSGTHRPLDPSKGSTQPILIGGKEVGLVLRSKEDVKPIYISPGHKCDLRFSIDIVKRSLRGFRLPEPLRVAHLLANKYRQKCERDKSQTDHNHLNGSPA